MKSFKNFVAEVAQPKPEEEKRFKDQHTYEVIKHPVATDAQFTGDIDKPKAKRIADQEGDANYDKAVKNPEKRMAAESVEQLDELSPELLKRYRKKAKTDIQKRAAKADIKDKQIQRIITAKGGNDGNQPNSSYYYHDSPNMRAKNAERQAHRKLAKAKISAHEANESVEQIDEISKELAGRYIKQAQVSSADAGMDTASQDKNIRQRGIKTFLKRRKGVDSAVKRLMKRDEVGIKDEELSPKQKKIDANKNGKIDGHDLAMLRSKKKNEEVELDETTSSAMKKMVTQTGPDGKTRTVMKKAKADRMDDRGQDQITTRESVELDEAKIERWKINKYYDTVNHEDAAHGHHEAARAYKDSKKKGAGEVAKHHTKAGEAHDEAHEHIGKGNYDAAHKMSQEAVQHARDAHVAAKKHGFDGNTSLGLYSKGARGDSVDVHKAHAHLRESVELEEAVKVKRGPLRLKDGSQIMVTKEDADLLSRMFSDLSPNNQRQMQKVMMMDKAGFEEIRGFAREAL